MTWRPSGPCDINFENCSKLKHLMLNSYYSGNYINITGNITAFRKRTERKQKSLQRD